MFIVVKLKPHEAPCTRCGVTGSHLCDGEFDDGRFACSSAVLRAFIEERYRDEGREHGEVAKHVADCAPCGAWVRKREERHRWVAGSGLLAAKLVRIVDAPRALWPSAEQLIPEGLRGRKATIVDVLRPYQERVEVRLHRATKGTPRTSIIVPLTWLEATEHQPAEPAPRGSSTER